MTTGLAGPKPLSAVSQKDVKKTFLNTTTLTTLHVGSNTVNKHAIFLFRFRNSIFSAISEGWAGVHQRFGPGFEVAVIHS